MVKFMKKIKYIGTIATICISIIGCIKENEIHNLDDRFVIYASREDLHSTKTELQSDNSIVWTKGDEISLFVDSGTNGGYRFVSTNEANASSTTFISSENIEMNGSSTYWAVYPYNESTSCNGASITTTLPSEQVAKPGSFDEDLFISVAKSNSNSMSFKNVCGGIKFSVANEGIKEVVFKSNDGSMISGVLNIAFSDNGLPEVKSISNGKDEIKVIAPDNGAFTVGENYYVVIPPVSFPQGISLKYITSSDQYAETVIESSSVIERSVFSRLMEKDYCATFKYNPYLVFYSEGQSSITFTSDPSELVTIEWSYDGENWNKYTINNSATGEYEELSFSTDRPLYMRGNNPFGFTKNLSKRFTLYGDKVKCKGNLLALIDYKQRGQSFDIINLSYLFAGCNQLVQAPDLTGIDANLVKCNYMFSGCISLQSAPVLPSSEFEAQSMFSGCKSLVKAPSIPENNMRDRCYSYMFYGCTSLTKAPELPATSLAPTCYYGMFKGCTSLTTPPKLPARSLAKGCYTEMFEGCTSLEIAPDLPATILSDDCYMFMFRGCTSLKMAPQLPATKMYKRCYRSMFEGCTSLEIAPLLPATILWAYCYEAMFKGCVSLITPPELSATDVSQYCYRSMFEGCTSLEIAPKLPATNLADCCYESMFRDCSELKYVNARFYHSSAQQHISALYGWLDGVYAKGTFVGCVSDYMAKTYYGVPQGWFVTNE